jgi:murein L,D-transpeptidase YcbB/YkuD
MKDKSFSQAKRSIALASVATIFIGAIIYVPVLKFSQPETEVVYKNVPVPVFINVTPINTEMIDSSESEDSDQDENITQAENTKELLTKSLRLGDTDKEVKILQKFLNENGFTISSSGLGSPGQETELFGRNTKDALIRFQEANKEEILAPYGLFYGTGVLGQSTIDFINKSLSAR